MSEHTDVYVRKVPTDLWRKAKITAVRSGVTAREIVIAALTDYLAPLDDE